MSAFSQTTPLSQPLVRALSSAPEHGRSTRTADWASSAQSRALDETLFRDALERERCRADRFEEGFVIALVTLQRRGASTIRWERAVHAVSAVAAQSDLIGWLEAGSVIGVIRSTGSISSANDGRVAADEMRSELQACLAADFADCLVRTEVYDPTQDARWPLVGRPRPRTAIEIGRAVVKRAIDVVGSVMMLVLFAPLMAVTAVLIKATSSGPVFFRQQRVGAGGRSFTMVKFRTIRADADATLHEQYVESFIRAGARRPKGAGTVCKLVNDPRVTRVGRFLRRSSLDEVPQFWNVLVGEMSLVGPRPPLPYEVARYKTWHRRRVLEAKPGMTGLWQVTGRSRTSFDEMVRLDLRYARNCTILNDLKILLATPRAVLSGKGAH